MKRISATAMVYAAGFGTRMGALTNDRPKPLLTVGGETLLDRALDVVVGSGLERAVVNLHYHGDKIRSHLLWRSSPQILFSDESGKILETGGGLKKALSFFDREAVFALNSDAFWQGANAASALQRAWDPAQMDALLMLMPKARMANKGRKGDFLADDRGRLRWPSADELAPLIYTGAQIIKTALFRSWPQEVFSTVEIWNHMITNQRCFGIAYGGDWVDVGRPEAIAEAESLLRK